MGCRGGGRGAIWWKSAPGNRIPNQKDGKKKKKIVFPNR